MTDFNQYLELKLDQIRDAGLHRRLREVDSPQSIRIVQDEAPLLNFSSNDYLGLANHPTLREAAVIATEKYGTGSGASRLISGSLAIHHQLEELLANYKGTEQALSFSSGYSAAIGTIGALVGKNDVVVLDKLVHACIVDAARLSGARLRVYRHNDLDHLASILKWASGRPTASRVLIITESVFSMDGDLAPLTGLIELKQRFGAWLMLDEAHSTGVFGRQGVGLAQREGVAGQIEVQMGTLGKALGAAGGYICGTSKLIEVLVNRARSFIFSTAPVPAASAAAIAGVNVARSAMGDQKRERLWRNVNRLSSILKPFNPHESGSESPIIPWIIGDERKAVTVADQLRARGVFSPAIRYPSVSRGRARLRFTVCADHTEHDLDQLQQALTSICSQNEPVRKA